MAKWKSDKIMEALANFDAWWEEHGHKMDDAHATAWQAWVAGQTHSESSRKRRKLRRPRVRSF